MSYMLEPPELEVHDTYSPMLNVQRPGVAHHVTSYSLADVVEDLYAATKVNTRSRKPKRDRSENPHPDHPLCHLNRDWSISLID